MIYLGGDNVYSNQFTGLMDEIRFYDSVISPMDSGAYYTEQMVDLNCNPFSQAICGSNCVDKCLPGSSLNTSTCKCDTACAIGYETCSYSGICSPSCPNNLFMGDSCTCSQCNVDEYLTWKIAFVRLESAYSSPSNESENGYPDSDG